MFIPFKAKTPDGNACRQRMVDYVVSNEGMDVPFALSFLYPSEDYLPQHCNINMTSTGLEPAWMDNNAWRQAYYGREYADIYDAVYPINNMRNLAMDMVRVFISVFVSIDTLVTSPRKLCVFTIKNDSTRIEASHKKGKYWEEHHWSSSPAWCTKDCSTSAEPRSILEILEVNGWTSLETPSFTLFKIACPDCNAHPAIAASVFKIILNTSWMLWSRNAFSDNENEFFSGWPNRCFG